MMRWEQAVVAMAMFIVTVILVWEAARVDVLWAHPILGRLVFLATGVGTYFTGLKAFTRALEGHK